MKSHELESRKIIFKRFHSLCTNKQTNKFKRKMFMDDIAKIKKKCCKEVKICFNHLMSVQMQELWSQIIISQVQQQKKTWEMGKSEINQFPSCRFFKSVQRTFFVSIWPMNFVFFNLRTQSILLLTNFYCCHIFQGKIPGIITTFVQSLENFSDSTGFIRSRAFESIILKRWDVFKISS